MLRRGTNFLNMVRKVIFSDRFKNWSKKFSLIFSISIDSKKIISKLLKFFIYFIVNFFLIVVTQLIINSDFNGKNDIFIKYDWFWSNIRIIDDPVKGYLNFLVLIYCFNWKMRLKKCIKQFYYHEKLTETWKK